MYWVHLNHQRSFNLALCEDLVIEEHSATHSEHGTTYSVVAIMVSGRRTTLYTSDEEEKAGAYMGYLLADACNSRFADHRYIAQRADCGQ